MGLAALPDGGVAYEVADQSLGVLNADGTTRWHTKNPFGYGAMLADSAGHLDFERILSNQSCSDAVANCDGFAVDQLEASNGQVQRSVSLVSSEDPSRFWFCGGFSLGPGLFYVLDRLAPADGEICSDGDTQPQLQAFALPGTTGPYPTPPATTIPPTTGPTGGGGGSGGTGGGGAGGSGSPPVSGVPIVLVPGLSAETKTTTPSEPCEKAGQQMEYLCTHLRSRYPVYVVGASPTGRGPRVVLNSVGDLNANAVALRAFLKNTVKRPALLVAHSMGGLISRLAVSKYHAPAAGLFTVGTPFDGSFMADIATGIDTGCLTANATMCALQAVIAKWFPVNSTAAHEMTAASRTLERLAPPAVPVWTVAGTAIGDSAGTSYVFPNDLVVGESSAHGVLANLGQQKREINLSLYHFKLSEMGLFGPTLNAILPTADPELESPSVVGQVISAAEESTIKESGAASTGLASMPVGSRAYIATTRRSSQNPAVTYHTTLVVTHTVGSHRRSPAGELDVATHQFQAFCGTTPLPTIVLPGGAFAFDADQNNCTHPDVIPPPDGSLVITSDVSRVHASVSIRGTHVTIVLTTRRAVQAATLRLGNHTVKLRRYSNYRWQTTLTMGSSPLGILVARSNGQIYDASISL